MKRLLAAVLLALFVSVVFAESAQAWNVSPPSTYSGYRWKHETVCVEDLTPSNGLRDEVRNAVRDWNYNTRIVMWYRIGKGSCVGYSNQVITVEQGRHGKASNMGWTGISYYQGKTARGTATGIIVSAQVVLNTSYYGGPLLNGILLGWDHVATHELGHALGLGHVLSTCDSVMNLRSGCTGPYQTTSNDRRAIWQIYSV